MVGVYLSMGDVISELCLVHGHLSKSDLFSLTQEIKRIGSIADVKNLQQQQQTTR